jgi:hypothetical protein
MCLTMQRLAGNIASAGPQGIRLTPERGDNSLVRRGRQRGIEAASSSAFARITSNALFVKAQSDGHAFAGLLE